MTRFVKIWSNPTQGPLQISQLVVTDITGANVARGKQCSASSTYDSQMTCNKALDGIAAVRHDPDIYHALGEFVFSWFVVDLGAPFIVTSVVYYNRASNQNRAIGTELQLINQDGIVTAQRTLDGSNIQTFTFSPTATSTVAVTYQCDSAFEGGGWVLVRRIKSGSNWHPATDDLKGSDVYGTYGTASSDSTFSVAYSSWLNQATEFLFITGASLGLCVAVVTVLRYMETQATAPSGLLQHMVQSTTISSAMVQARAR